MARPRKQEENLRGAEVRPIAKQQDRFFLARSKRVGVDRTDWQRITSGLAKGVGKAVGQYRDHQIDEGRAAWNERYVEAQKGQSDLQKAFAKAVGDGSLAEEHSPYFLIGYRESMARAMASQASIAAESALMTGHQESSQLDGATQIPPQEEGNLIDGSLSALRERAYEVNPGLADDTHFNRALSEEWNNRYLPRLTQLQQRLRDERTVAATRNALTAQATDMLIGTDQLSGDELSEALTRFQDWQTGNVYGKSVKNPGAVVMDAMRNALRIKMDGDDDERFDNARELLASWSDMKVGNAPVTKGKFGEEFAKMGRIISDSETLATYEGNASRAQKNEDAAVSFYAATKDGVQSPYELMLAASNKGADAVRRVTRQLVENRPEGVDAQAWDTTVTAQMRSALARVDVNQTSLRNEIVKHKRAGDAVALANSLALANPETNKWYAEMSDQTINRVGDRRSKMAGQIRSAITNAPPNSDGAERLRSIQDQFLNAATDEERRDLVAKFENELTEVTTENRQWKDTGDTQRAKAMAALARGDFTTAEGLINELQESHPEYGHDLVEERRKLLKGMNAEAAGAADIVNDQVVAAVKALSGDTLQLFLGTKSEWVTTKVTPANLRTGAPGKTEVTLNAHAIARVDAALAETSANLAEALRKDEVFMGAIFEGKLTAARKIATDKAIEYIRSTVDTERWREPVIEGGSRWKGSTRNPFDDFVIEVLTNPESLKRQVGTQPPGATQAPAAQPTSGQGATTIAPTPPAPLPPQQVRQVKSNLPPPPPEMGNYLAQFKRAAGTDNINLHLAKPFGIAAFNNARLMATPGTLEAHSGGTFSSTLDSHVQSVGAAHPVMYGMALSALGANVTKSGKLDEVRQYRRMYESFRSNSHALVYTKAAREDWQNVEGPSPTATGMIVSAFAGAHIPFKGMKASKPTFKARGPKGKGFIPIKLDISRIDHNLVSFFPTRKALDEAVRRDGAGIDAVAALFKVDRAEFVKAQRALLTDRPD